ncbi:hypothetical protein GCM10009574_053590 [Streptomyces asiaticus]|uniref:Uncharacterized protein n=2 Tax=Streptomyces rhizosphaericus TaxID=114699 RepID=A0ABN1SBF0_9ACTN
MRHRLPARGPDLLDDPLGRALRRPGAVRGHAEVVDDDLRALGGEGERMRPPEAAARSGDDGDAPVAQSAHLSPPVVLPGRCRGPAG